MMRTRSNFALASLTLLGSALLIAGCQVAVDGSAAGPDAQGPGASAGSGSNPQGSAGSGASPGVGSAGASGGSTTSAPPGELNASYARLTRVEYQATIKAAFNVDPVVTGLPADDRIGPFTSNVATEDPMKEFVLASEDLAKVIVPSKLPTCTAATAATCVASNYQAPIEKLYRRALAPAEVTALANIVSSLEKAGLTSENATRGMLLSALISTDFLFRSTPVGGDAARGRRLSEHLSYALWDAPPDADLVAAGKVSAAELGASLKKQALRLGSDGRAVPVLARFVAQWLGVDTDERLSDPNAGFATSPLYAELQAFVKNALTTAAPVTSFVNGTQGFIQKTNFAAYAMSAVSSSADVVPVTWGASTARRGVLGEELFLDATRHPDKGRRPIFRGHLIRSALLCQTIQSPPAEVVALDGEVSDRTTDPRCSGCHTLMDPIGRSFAAMDLDNTVAVPPPVVNGAGEISGAFTDLPAMLTAIAGSQTYAECFSRHLLGFFLEQEPASVDSAAVGDVSAVVKSGGSLADAVAQAVVSLEKRSQTMIPWCTGQ